MMANDVNNENFKTRWVSVFLKDMISTVVSNNKNAAQQRKKREYELIVEANEGMGISMKKTGSRNQVWVVKDTRTKKRKKQERRH